MIQSIVHIALVVKDYDEAIEFNTRKLNFTLVEDIYQPEQDKRWVVIFGEIIMKWFSGGIEFIREPKEQMMEQLLYLKIYTEICGTYWN